MLEAFLIGLAAQPVTPAVLALLVDRVWPRTSARPPAMVQRLVGALVGRLNRADRPAATRQMRGFLLWSMVALLALGTGFGLARVLPALLPPEFVSFAEVLLLAAGMGFNGARAAARRAVEGVAGLSPVKAGEVAGIVCDRLATRLADGPVALVLGWLAFGLPGLFLFKAGQWLVAAVEADRDGAFGRAVRACHAVVTLPASFIAGVLIGFGRLPPRGLTPASAALTAALGRRGFASPVQRVAAALVLIDRAHALWLLALVVAGVAVATLV